MRKALKKSNLGIPKEAAQETKCPYFPEQIHPPGNFGTPPPGFFRLRGALPDSPPDPVFASGQQKS